MSLIPKLIKIWIKTFNIQRKLLNNVTTLRLLRPDGVLTPYQEVKTISSGWYLRFNSFRQYAEVLIASEENDFYQTLENSTHLALDGAVYEIVKGDVSPPDGEEPFFKIPCLRSNTETFDIS